jgi:hypothetical protein
MAGSGLIWILVGGLAVIIGGATLMQTYRRNQRQRLLPAVARGAGLDFSHEDRFNCAALPLPLFRKGKGREVENVMWRPDAAGAPVRVFDYGYYTEHRDNYGQVRRQWYRFSCALIQHNGSWPPLRIQHEGLLDKVGRAVGVTDIDFESEEFNRAFFVSCDDRRFASALIDPQMMELLLTTGGVVSLETTGRFLLLAADQVEAVVMPRMLALAEDVLAHVPPVVWELYPTLPDGAGTEVLPPREHALDPPDGTSLLGMYETRPSLLHPDESWDPTPDVDHDLQGHPVEPRPEDPWHDRPE